jgi:hypothetical protein
MPIATLHFSTVEQKGYEWARGCKAAHSATGKPGAQNQLPNKNFNTYTEKKRINLTIPKSFAENALAISKTNYYIFF